MTTKDMSIVLTQNRVMLSKI